MRTLLVGVSTRAIAESALQAGHRIVTVDYFGDRDQKQRVENHSLLRDLELSFSAQGLREASRRVKFEAVVYASNLENHPRIVEELARGRVLLGNEPSVLREVRDWRTLRKFCRRAEIPYPTTLLAGEEEQADPTVRWLRKPARSGGGRGVRLWDGKPLDASRILQAEVVGRSASAAFVADGRESVVIGLTEQLIGCTELGASGFAWCGNILPLELDPQVAVSLLDRVETMVARLARRFGLRGVNGLDLVIGNGPEGSLCPFLVEVNPRYTASMELIERAYGLNVFSLHMEAMVGRLPDFSLRARPQGVFLSKGIVYARQTVIVPETDGWTAQDRRDVPFPGDRIEAGHPICTVFARGPGREECLRNLFLRVRAVRGEIGDRGEEGLARKAHTDHRAYA